MVLFYSDTVKCQGLIFDWYGQVGGGEIVFRGINSSVENQVKNMKLVTPENIIKGTRSFGRNLIFYKRYYSGLGITIEGGFIVWLESLYDIQTISGLFIYLTRRVAGV